MPKLMITQGESSREVPLRSGDTVGRVAGNAIQLKIPEASRKHCCFTEEQDSWWVEDLGSSNGTLVNGRKVTKFELQDGDEIQVGLARLRFLTSDVEEDAEPEIAWGDDDLSLEEVPYLVLQGAGREGDVLALPEGRVTVGRKARHALQIKDVSVSGDHAEILIEGGRVTVRDLDSSNGTFVGGRKVKEMELVAGDRLRFGVVEALFEVGDPDAEQARSASAAHGTVTMDMGGMDADATFELHDLPPRKEGIWNILAIVLLLGLGGGAFWLIGQGGAGGSGAGASATSPAGNLVPERLWSFESDEIEEAEDEDGSLPTWDKESSQDPGETEEVADPVFTGRSALAVMRGEDSAAATVAFLNQPLPVSAGQPYRLAVQTLADGGDAHPLIQVRWLARQPGEGEDPETVATDRVFGSADESEWTELAGQVVAPPGAVFAMLGVGATGAGRIVFDNVVMTLAQGAVPTAVENFLPTLSAQGTLRLSRFGRVVLDGVGVAAALAGRDRGQDALLVPARAGAAAVQGTLRAGLGDLETVLESGAGALRVHFRGPGLGAAGKLVIPLAATRDDGLQVTLLDGAAAHRHENDFADLPAEAIILALTTSRGSDQVKIRFADEQGSGVKRSISLRRDAGRPVIGVDARGLPSLVLDFQLGFAAEESAARELEVKARAALGSKEFGRAVQLCDEIISRYPFVRKTEQAATALRDDILKRGRRDLSRLAADVDDVIFFRTFEGAGDLVAAVSTFRRRFAGSPVEPDAEALWKRLSDSRSEWLAARQERSAARAMARARDYEKSGKQQLARVFFQYVSEQLKESEWAEQARQALQKLKSGKGTRRDG